MRTSKSFYRLDKTIQYITMNLIQKYIRVVVWILRIENPSPFYILGERIVSLMKHSGKGFTASYLKEAFRITVKYISGEKELKTLDELRMGLSFGLPKILPGEIRNFIRSRDRPETKAALTILSIYRIIKSVPRLKLETITAPYTGVESPFSDWEIYSFARSVLPRMKKVDSRFIISMSAGPNSNPSVLGLPKDALALFGYPELLGAMNTIAQMFNCRDLLANLLAEAHILKKANIQFADLKVSKLAFKEEAAGKVRVFAILDGWTQSFLSGLHDSLASILLSIEQDGTFDQDKPLKILMATDPKRLFSFDLSAATDRLPIHIQVKLLSFLFNSSFAQAWKTLLVDRPYSISDTRFSSLRSEVRYAVGQPMGALSSFNMLGLTHHMIVQISALRAGHTG
jgi:hypothetical protein